MKKFFASLSACSIIISANAQIIYTDVNPDSVTSANYSYSFDLNKDGIEDFILTEVNGSVRCGAECGIGHTYDITIKSAPGSLNAIMDDKMNNALALDSSAVIFSSASHWSTTNSPPQILSDASNCSACGTTYSGYWKNNDVKYLGLKLAVNHNIYYGWIKLSVLVNGILGSITIREYACNSIADQPILAGETSCTTPKAYLNESGPLSFCAQDSVILTAKGTGYLYQWKKDGGNIIGATSKKYVAKLSGIYKCKVTNSCGNKSSNGDTVIISCLKLFSDALSANEKDSKAVQLTVAPNPFSNSATISFSLSQSQKISVSIYDLTGRLIKILADEQMQSGTHQLIWNAKNERGNAVNAGIYFLKMNADGFSRTERLIIIK